MHSYLKAWWSVTFHNNRGVKLLIVVANIQTLLLDNPNAKLYYWIVIILGNVQNMNTVKDLET